MVLSQALAWIAAFLCIVETLRYVARISRVDTLNRAFHRIHIPAGILLLATAGLHSLLAGNFSDVSVSEIELAPALLTANWGTACFLCAIFLAVGYLPHRKLRRKWMFVHRVLAFLMLLLLVFHLADVGIHLPDRWTAPSFAENAGHDNSVYSEREAATPTPELAATASPLPTVEVATPTAAPTEEPILHSSQPEIISEEPMLEDSIYTGTGQGRNGTITVNVTVSSGKITDIEITGENETPKYFSRAKSVINSILSAQSTEVDAVTGATISAEGIKAVVEDALEQ